jgi:hypothetical protein
MAIQKTTEALDSNYEHSIGIKVDNTYHRIADAVVIRYKENNSDHDPLKDADWIVKLQVLGYPSASSSVVEPIITGKYVSVNVTEIDSQTADTFIGKCYQYLKSIDPFKDGSDV